MESYTGIFVNYGRGLKRQVAKEGIIEVPSLKSGEWGQVIGWIVGWPEKNPKLFGRIIGSHGKSGYLMVKFKHGLPGEALGKRVVIMRKKPEETKPRSKSAQANEESKIVDIEGIGPSFSEKLGVENIHTTNDLLEAGATTKSRKQLAEKTGISPHLILEWVNLADLFRIKGVGEQYADLLEEAGVDTVIELSTRNATNLHAKVVEVNEAKKLVRRVPTLAMIEDWISEAKTLPRKIEY
jgi:ribosomal protein L35AE/L33A